jgi:hypothetical protein
MTWTLWAFTYYVDLDAEWTSQWGEPWSFERLVQNEVQSKVVGSACGGNHRLFVLTLARDKHLRAGRPLTGVWLEADQKIKRHLEIARAMQNADGSFSTKSYEGPGYSAEFNERLNTTGHTLEFVTRALPDARLNELWVRRAVSMLSQELINKRQMPADCGPLYHSLNALITYRNRVNPPKSPEEKAVPEVAIKPTAGTTQDAEPRLTPPEPALPIAE